MMAANPLVPKRAAAPCGVGTKGVPVGAVVLRAGEVAHPVPLGLTQVPLEEAG